VVDHGLQPGSAARAEATVALLAERGVPGEVLPVRVTGGGGLEAARPAGPVCDPSRGTALRRLAGAARTHLDDQAETVLLGLGRGSGPRSLAGMTRYDPPWLRPLLGVRRSTTRAACAELGVPVWDDPHNADPRFTRVRLRTEVLPLLEDVLAGGVAKALARTAAQLREDGAALDEWAALAGRMSPCRPWAAPGWRRRSWPPTRPRCAAGCCAAGSPPAASPRSPTPSCGAPTSWSGGGGGQGEITLAGEWVLARRHGRLVLDSPGTVE